MTRTLRGGTVAVLAAFVCVAEEAPPLTLRQAVEVAVEKYPAVRAASESAAAAAAGVGVAQTSYLPRADLLGQVNRATRKNVFGLLMPQAVLPSISGPVLGTNALTSVWGSAVGVLVSWEPFDFGLRRASVETADALRRRADLTVARTRFEVAAAAAEAFLTVLAADQTVVAARASLERSRVLERVVEALVKAELRPGAEAARARAEVAAAQTQLALAEQAAAVARAGLAQWLGVDPSRIAVEPGALLSRPPDALPSGSLDAHPAAREQNAALEEAAAREQALARSWFPRFNLQAASYARGTGASPDGTTGGALTGLGPNIHNWAAGLTVTFPLADWPALRARQNAEAHRHASETARYQQVVAELAARFQKAQAALEGARRVAAQAPALLEAARAAEQQATSRYRAGLGTLVEVADATRLLAQAESGDALARLNVWLALLGVAAARGDLAPLLDAAGR
jgi:outer membrane protein TolC